MAPSAVATPYRVPGIDTSEWQLDVDWAAVASAPARFVIMRATRGRSYVDPKYGPNLAGATANGLIVGAYHRAKPGLVDPDDPRVEADHFLSVARNAAGDVLPVLDIEETGGLSVTQLRTWIRGWLQRVHDRTGVRAMIYSSPTFWRNNLGNTRWFADHGYPLWIAHWGASSPDVPAANWGGKGWTFWQWTATGSISGIGTDVDRDRFRGPSLAAGRIASIEVVPAAAGRIVGERISCGSGSTDCSRLANPGDLLTFTASPAPDAALLGWTGVCTPAGASPTCTVTAHMRKTVSAVFGYPVDVEVEGSGGGTVSASSGGPSCRSSCTELIPAESSVTFNATEDSASEFGGWNGACAGSDPDCTIAVVLATQLRARFDSVVRPEEDGDGTRYAWGREADARAIGGSYLWDRRASASATFRFRGGSTTLLTLSGPAMGKARIAIDGTTVDTFDGYAPSLRAGTPHRFTGLGAGPHALTVTVLGTKRAAAKGTKVAVDALRWAGVLHRDPAPASASWAALSDPEASGGAFAISDAPGADARLRFTGTGLTIRVLRGPKMGRAEVRLEGHYLRTVDLYAADAGFASIRLVAGLKDEPHVVRLVVLRSHRPSSGGNSIALDRWVVA